MIRAKLRPDLQTDYSCPGSATADMLAADGCFFPAAGLALHDEFADSQADAAVAFLTAHAGQVSAGFHPNDTGCAVIARLFFRVAAPPTC